MITIETLDESGWGRLREVGLAVLGERPDTYGTYLADKCRDTRDEWVGVIRAATWLLAVESELPVGLVGCLERPECPEEAEIIGPWVHPRGRGSSAADLLVRAACGWAVTRRLGSLQVWVADDDETARSCYERHRFRSTGEIVPPAGGRTADEHRMRRLWPSSSGYREDA